MPTGQGDYLGGSVSGASADVPYLQGRANFQRGSIKSVAYQGPTNQRQPLTKALLDVLGVLQVTEDRLHALSGNPGPEGQVSGNIGPNGAEAIAEVLLHSARRIEIITADLQGRIGTL